MFGFWSFIKMLAATFMRDEVRQSFIESTFTGKMVDIFFTVFFMGLFVGFDLWTRIYVGTSARAESNGQRKNGKKIGNLYIVLAIMLVLFNLISLISYLVSEKSDFTSYIDSGVTIIVELTSIITLVEMIRAAFIIRHLRREVQRLKDRRAQLALSDRGRQTEPG
ncbi:MAG: hypothetical protein J6O71_05050 [Lachnospiraceae bacterium]|nr:hypothetical protein [Lachnospiraceae bacterium]